MRSDLFNILNDELHKLDYYIHEEDINKLIDFVILLKKWNKVYNLTSISNEKEMLYKHIIDSIVVSKYLHGEKFIDVGTGPGLPGIPLSILNIGAQFYLLDSKIKRINFIRNAKIELKINNVTPILSRCEDFVPEIKFDVVLSRAFASLKDMLSLCSSYVNTNGAFYALKGIIDKNEISDIPSNFKIENVIKLSVPSCLGNRHLVIIKKVE
ncbi:MAG: 16S rRNA (guanine(527)-N(7))-methyltransferase RsmG [Succinivibrionaceae bacterium]